MHDNRARALASASTAIGALIFQGCRNAISTISRCKTDMRSRSMRFQQVVYLADQHGIVLMDYRMVIPNNWNDLQTFGEQIFPTSSAVGRASGLNSFDRVCTNKNPPASQAAWPIKLRHLPIQSLHNFPLQKRTLLVEQARKFGWVRFGAIEK